jgi:hypothetical protein
MWVSASDTRPWRGELGPGQGELGRRDDVLVGQHLGVLVFDRGHVGLRLGAPEVRLVDERHDLEHLLVLVDQLALVDEDLGQVAALLGPHLDVLDGLDLRDVLVGELDVLAQRGRDREHGGLLVLLRRRPACRHKEGREEQDECEGSRHGLVLGRFTLLHVRCRGSKC